VRALSNERTTYATAGGWYSVAQDLAPKPNPFERQQFRKATSGQNQVIEQPVPFIWEGQLASGMAAQFRHP